MKSLILLLIIPFTVLLITSCDSGSEPITPKAQGNIFLTSNPAGAQIWLDGTNTSKIDSIIGGFLKVFLTYPL